MSRNHKFALLIRRRAALTLVLLTGCASATFGQQQGSKATPIIAFPGHNLYRVEVEATKEWTDTKIDVRGGAKLKITADGTITYSQKHKTFGPTGIHRGFADLVHEYAVPNGTHGELIGRLGSGDSGEAFEIGDSLTYTVPVAEHLYLGVNQSERDAAEAEGGFHATVEVIEEGTSTTIGGPAESETLDITRDLLDSLPRRVADEKHDPGDMVNIVLVGTEAQVVNVFTTAGWVRVDKSVGSTIEAGLFDTFEKKDYLTMPMSTLYLFDRPQDYGFAHAEPVRVVMARNHLRVWKSTFTIKGRPLWCVAATHDIGFERDQRNNLVTHKIDPEIDGEREYVNHTLSATGLVAARGHLTPAKPLTTAKTATGGEFHSDGRILALVLANNDAAAK